MGLGGNIIWTAVLKDISIKDGRPPLICFKPKLSDLILGVLWDRSRSFENDLVYRNLSFITFTSVSKKHVLFHYIDLLFSFIIYPYFLKLLYEKLIIALCKRKYRNNKIRILHLDMLTYSYAKKQTSKRMIWKSGGHVSEIIAREIGFNIKNPTYYLSFTQKEEKWIANFLLTLPNNVKLLIIEAGSNKEWFGNLRQWPYENWEKLVELIQAKYPELMIIQIGLLDTKYINGCIDLRGKTNFRQACLLIRECNLFVGTEGGLMHAARAVLAPSVIIWGGVTLPEFAGHVKEHSIICNYVSCSPCGNLGWCDNNIKCMNGISVKTVFDKIDLSLCSID